MPTTNTLFEWRRRLASMDGPESPVTRHVLLTLSLHMDSSGGSCHPSTRLLKEETGLTRRTVEEHLRIGEKEGWIWTDPEWRSGQRKEYQATLPRQLQDAESGVIGSPLSSHESAKSGEARSPVQGQSGERDSPVQGSKAEQEIPRFETKAGKEVPRSEGRAERKAGNLTHESGESDAKSGERGSPEDVVGRQEDDTTNYRTTDPPNPPTAELRGADEPSFDSNGRPRQLLRDVCLLGAEEGTTSRGWTFGAGLLCTQWDWLVDRTHDRLEALMALTVARPLAESRGIIESGEPFTLTLLVAGMNVREGDASDDPEDWRFYQDCVHEAEKRQMIDHPLVAETAARLPDVDELIEEAG